MSTRAFAYLPTDCRPSGIFYKSPDAAHAVDHEMPTAHKGKIADGLNHRLQHQADCHIALPSPISTHCGRACLMLGRSGRFLSIL